MHMYTSPWARFAQLIGEQLGEKLSVHLTKPFSLSSLPMLSEHVPTFFSKREGGRRRGEKKNAAQRVSTQLFLSTPANHFRYYLLHSNNNKKSIAGSASPF